jgi:DNA-binding NarL/FixJ family response regulator
MVLGPAEIRLQVLSALRHERVEICEADSVGALADAHFARSPSLVILAGSELGPARAGTIAAIREYSPDLHVVLVCRSLQGWEVRAALAAGVSGIVLSDELTTTLCPCLLAVQAGQICVPDRNARQVEPPVLSSREKQILGLVVMGYMNGQIAEQLFLAESTVKGHQSSAFGKLEVHSRNEAVDLILNPQCNLFVGILALGGAPLDDGSGLAA